MTYQLTPDQRRGILAADLVSQAHGIPAHIDLTKALAGLVVALRDGGDVANALVRGAVVLEQYRNPTAAAKDVTDQRLQKALERIKSPQSDRAIERLEAEHADQWARLWACLDDAGVSRAEAAGLEPPYDDGERGGEDGCPSYRRL